MEGEFLDNSRDVVNDKLFNWEGLYVVQQFRAAAVGRITTCW
jgi:hypothetical protein